MTEKEQIKHFMSKLNLTEEQAKELVEYDYAVEHSTSGLEYDLTPKEQKIAKAYTNSQTKNKKNTNEPHKRELKPNETKGGLIALLFDFLSKNKEFNIQNLEKVNKERQISFTISDNSYDLVLIQKRKSKK